MFKRRQTESACIHSHNANEMIFLNLHVCLYASCIARQSMQATVPLSSISDDTLIITFKHPLCYLLHYVTYTYSFRKLALWLRLPVQ